MATFRELLSRLGVIRVVEPVTDYAFQIALNKRWENQDGDDPHGRPWHVSAHASSFPGDKPACPRFAMYGFMDVPKGGGPNRWLTGVAEVGKTFELGVVRANRDAGFLCQSNQPGRSTDPDARTPDGKEHPQMGFEEEDTWLTGSVDMPIVPWGYNSPHIVEIKTKHEDDITNMQMGARSYEDKHRHQLLCSLGLAHDHPDDFLDAEGRPLVAAHDGSIYYGARDTSWDVYGGTVQTFEFYFEYDPVFMEKGREQLRNFKGYFIEGILPQLIPRKNARSHPNGPGWRWSEGLCKYCPLKKPCKADYEAGVTEIKDSAALIVAKFMRPGYDPALKREAVFNQWKTNDPLAS